MKRLFFVLIPIMGCIRLETGALKCEMKNATCSDISVPEGFRFNHECPEGSEISVEGSNKTQLALADLSKQTFEYRPDIKKMDNHSVTTENCQDLTITCVSTGSHSFEEKCEEFKTISENTTLIQPNTSMTPSSNNWSPEVIAYLVISTVVVLIIGYLVTSYCFWKKEKGSQQNKGYFMYTARFSCFKRLVPPSFCRNQRGSGFQMVETSDLERQDNGVIRNGRDLHGSGESDQYTLESVNSGDTAAPKTNAPFDHRPVNGFSNMRDDPGGNNGTKGREMKKTEQLENGGTAAHLQAEEKSLLPDQRAADGGLEMEGEAVALVNKLSSNQDRVNRGSDALFIDVESTSPEKPANEI